MKRWRHYKKETAILLSAFGSVQGRERYEELRDYIQKRFADHSVFLSFASRTVLKKLSEQGIPCKNLAESLAYLDREGFRRIVVGSINLFPTDEHEMLLKTVKGFAHFAPSALRSTLPVFSRTKAVNEILPALNREMHERYNTDFYLYVAHGSPYLDQSGVSAYVYAKDLLQALSEKNFFCTLEGTFPCALMGGSFNERLRSFAASGRKPTLTIVPLLLVSGVHFDEDIQGIRESLANEAGITVAESPVRGEAFHLMEREEIRLSIAEEIEMQLRQFP